MKSVREKIAAGHYENKKPYESVQKDRDAWAAYMDEDARLKLEFRKDLAKEHGVEGHRKEDLLFSIAWDEGHSNGYSEVANYYETLADLLR